jgi:predicted PurR-regulated permease PerM
MAQDIDSVQDVPRTTLLVGAIGALLIATIWILRPFLSAFLWAAMIVISTWPVLLGVQARVRGRRGIATAVMVVALLLILVIPLSVSLVVIVGNLDNVTAWFTSLGSVALPPAPEWLSHIPLAGPKIQSAWEEVEAGGANGLRTLVAPYGGRVIRWLVAQMGGVGAMILQFLITVIMCAVLYSNGEEMARGVRRFAFRLGGANGERAVRLAANSVRGVAMGVVITAICQTLIAGTGLLIASIPGTPVLCAAILILCLAQLPPILVMLPAVIWKFYTGATFSGFVLLAFMIVASTIDNVLRPILIRKGADLPLLLVFTGVIGGMISLGIIGIFVGPVILAVSYTLLEEWIESRPAPVGEIAGSAAANGPVASAIPARNS